jgi:hypothetical protein
LIVTAGTTGIKSENKGVITKVNVKFLEEKLIPACRQVIECIPVQLRNHPWIFQQDNAPAHTAKTNQAWLHSSSDFTLMPWPPTSRMCCG